MSVLVCPVCQGTMKEINREGILIDTCTQCRGVWLDRGELEKIAERLAATAGPPAQPYAPPPAQPYPQPQEQAQHYPQPQAQHYPQRHHDDGYRRKERDWDDDDDYKRHGKPYQKSKLSRLMDFFD